MIKIVLSIVLLGTLMFADEYTAEDRIKDMQELDTAMSLIQKGFMYSELSYIKEGVQGIKDNAISVEPPLKGDEKHFKKDETFSYRYTKRETARMIVHADDIVQDFQEGNEKQALNTYTKMLKQCMSCHAKIRAW